jgi:hypothetical protein
MEDNNMKKLLVLVLGFCLLFLSVNAGAQSKYQQVPGKVAIYNATSKPVELTIVGQESNLGIDPGRRLTRQFDPKAPVELKFWYFGDRKREIGRVSAYRGDVYVITPGGIQTITKVARPKKPGYEPDFNNPRAVIADLQKMKEAGQAKRANLVVVKCNYAINTINNFLKHNPEGDPSILKQRWQEAYNEYKKIK